MKYRNKKRKAAIWILEQICRPLKARATGLRNFEGANSYKEINEKYYDQYELKELINKQVFTRELLRDAADLLFINDHITIFENEKNIYDIGLKAYKKGEIALREDIYQDEIDQYNSDKKYLHLRWVLPTIALILTTITLILTTCNNASSKSDIQELKGRLNFIEHAKSFNNINYFLKDSACHYKIGDTICAQKKH